MGNSTDVAKTYRQNGYAHVPNLIPEEVAQAFLQTINDALGGQPIPVSRITDHPNLLHRPAFEVYGHHFAPMQFFLWALTPIVSRLADAELLPTYDYFRIYRQGDLCRVHHDRYSCEHSLSLTLGYSDGKPWALEVEKERTAPSSAIADTFDDGRFASLEMQIGDAVLYQGVNHRHGRISPNPNRWSAHLFLHWVDRNGPYREHAFDGQMKPAQPEFTFA